MIHLITTWLDADQWLTASNTSNNMTQLLTSGKPVINCACQDAATNGAAIVWPRDELPYANRLHSTNSQIVRGPKQTNQPIKVVGKMAT